MIHRTQIKNRIDNIDYSTEKILLYIEDGKAHSRETIPLRGGTHLPVDGVDALPEPVDEEGLADGAQDAHRKAQEYCPQYES